MKKIVYLLFLTLFVVIVSCGSNDDVAVTGIKLDNTHLTLKKGEKGKLVAVVSPQGATNSTIVWKSSNSSVVMVDENGNIEAIKGGTAIIDATTTDGKFSASCEVSVVIEVSAIILSQTSLSLEKGNSVKILPTVLPEDATDKKITWTSSNTDVATVDENGIVTGVNGGSVTVFAKSSDGQVSASCDVSVKVSLQDIALDQENISLIKGQSAQLNPIFVPADATNKEVEWSSANNNIVTVKDGTIIGVGVGSTIITVVSLDGNKSATCLVNVEKSENIGYNPYGDSQKW